MFLSSCPGIVGDENGKNQVSPVYGFHTDAGILWGFGLTEDDYENAVIGFVQACKDAGYDDILFLPIPSNSTANGGDGEIRFFFTSPTLASLNYEQGPDYIAVMSEEAKKQGLNLYLDIQALTGHRDSPENFLSKYSVPTESDLDSLINELADYGIKGIAEEIFGADWVAAVHEACQTNGLEYIHKATLVECEAFMNHGQQTIFQAYENVDAIMTEDYTSSEFLVTENLFPIVAGTMNIPYFTKGSDEAWASNSVSVFQNIILYKSLQFNPRGIYVLSWNTELLIDNPIIEIKDIFTQFRSSEDKPVCNFIFQLTADESWDQWIWTAMTRGPLSASINAIQASGFDIVFSTEPRAEADMYYVYTRGEFWGNVHEIDNILYIIDTGKPCFFHPVYFLPKTEGWLELRQKLGIDTSKVYISEPVTPATFPATYKEQQVPFLLGTDKFDSNTFNPILPDDIDGGQVLASGTLNGTEYALIISKDNLYLINGYVLHVDASYIISNIINNSLQRPSNAACVVGKTSLFYAFNLDPDDPNETSQIDIRFPNVDMKSFKWLLRDRDGQTTSGTSSYNAATGYQTTLSEESLLIIKAD